jgi:integrase
MAKAGGKRRDGIQERTNGDGSITYRAQIRIRGHAPISKSFTRRTDAKRWIETTKTAMRNGSALSTEAERTTLSEALERYLREVTPKKKGKEREGRRVKAWMKHPLAVRFLSQLRGVDFAKYRDARLTAGASESTVRSELMLLSALYKVARKEWGMDGLRNPISDVAVPNPGRSNARDRRLVGDEEKRLLDALKAFGPYYAPLAELAIESAMRQGELLSLTSPAVDLDKRIARLEDTKNSERRDVPLSTRAVEIIRALPRPIVAGAPLFPLNQDDVIRTFREACTAASIENLKFHDLRHEATSRICKRVSMQEAMKITGHKTPSMLMRYFHPKAEDLARKLA